MDCIRHSPHLSTNVVTPQRPSSPTTNSPTKFVLSTHPRNSPAIYITNELPARHFLVHSAVSSAWSASVRVILLARSPATSSKTAASSFPTASTVPVTHSFLTLLSLCFHLSERPSRYQNLDHHLQHTSLSHLLFCSFVRAIGAVCRLLASQTCHAQLFCHHPANDFVILASHLLSLDNISVSCCFSLSASLLINILRVSSVHPSFDIWRVGRFEQFDKPVNDVNGIGDCISISATQVQTVAASSNSRVRIVYNCHGETVLIMSLS